MTPRVRLEAAWSLARHGREYAEEPIREALAHIWSQDSATEPYQVLLIQGFLDDFGGSPAEIGDDGRPESEIDSDTS